MEVNIDLHLSGFVFAALLSATARSKKIQDGLLLGEFHSKQISSVSDSQQGKEFQKEEIIVHETVMNDGEQHLYDNHGQINNDSLGTILQTKNNNIVGWFSYRPNSKTYMSVREKRIVQNLLKIDQDNCKKMIFLLIAPSSDDIESVHNFCYKAFLCQAGCPPMAIKVNVINLGSDNKEMNYKQKSLLLGSKSQPSTNFMKESQLSQAQSFFNQTGSVSIADNSYSFIHKILLSMQKLHQDIRTCQEDREQVELEIRQMEELLANNTSKN